MTVSNGFSRPVNLRKILRYLSGVKWWVWLRLETRLVIKTLVAFEAVRASLMPIGRKLLMTEP